MIVGVGCRPDAKIFLTAPVLQIVPALKSGTGKVGYLILKKSVLLHLLDGVQIEVCALLLAGTQALHLLPCEWRPRFNLQQIPRDVPNPQIIEGLDKLPNRFCCLLRCAQHQIDRNILKACLLCQLHALHRLLKAVAPSQIMQLVVVCRLHPHRDAVEAALPEGAQGIIGHRSRVCLQGNLAVISQLIALCHRL